MALRTHTITIPFSTGLAQREDARALQPPHLVRCQNAVFTKTGGIQTRKPFTALSTDIVGGGTVSNLRKLATFRNELLLFTDSKLYSWSSAESAWQLKGDHEAVAIDERQVVTRTTEQITPDCATLDGVTFLAWLDKGDQVYLSAIDTVTGTTLLAPTAMGANTRRPRLIALTDKVLLFVFDGTSIKAKALDPDDISTSAASALTTISSAINTHYDVQRKSGTLAVMVAATTTISQYTVRNIDESIVTSGAVVKARTADGPLAVAVSPDGLSVAVARFNGANVEGDILDNAHADVHVNLALGGGTSPYDQVTAAFRSIQDGGNYRCYVFWSTNERDDSLGFSAEYNYMDDAGNLGTEAVLAHRTGIAAHAFDQDGVVYVWTVFANSTSVATGGVTGAAVQNIYLLYGAPNDGPRLVSKALPGTAGGFAQQECHLPSSQQAGDKTTVCLETRRLIPTGEGGAEYAARAPVIVDATFDDNRARQTIELGRALYTSGGLPLLYDGEGLVELGFDIAPWYFDVQTVGSGSLAAGDRSYRTTWRWDTAQGELERSATNAFATATFTASQKGEISLAALHTTRKTGTRGDVALEVWRSKKDPTSDAPYFLITDKDPTATGDNGYITNDPTDLSLATYTDDMTDDTAGAREALTENSQALSRFAPPGGGVWAASGHRCVTRSMRL